MLGIDPLSAGALMILAAGAPKCEMPAPTQIDVIPKTLDIRYDYSKTMAQIQAYQSQSSTIDPHSFGGTSIMQGFMRGGISAAPRVLVKYATYDSYNAACAWYDKIEVVLEIDPTIVIAREVYNDRCMREGVLDHEMKHIKVDRKIVNKYAKQIGQKLYKELQVRGFKSQMVPSSMITSVVQRMQQTVIQLVQHEVKKMELERIDIQRTVDSKEEYERVSNLCPAFKKKLQQSFAVGVGR